jgi:hypothetical protein
MIAQKIKERISEGKAMGFVPSVIRIGSAYRKEAEKELGNSYEGIPIYYIDQVLTISILFVSEGA